jgi:hypothetical protein
VVYRSPPRIDWAPDDHSLVSCIEGVVHVHDLSGRASPRARAAIYTREVAAHDVLDARFTPDGRILGVDHRGTLVWQANGELVAQRHMSEPRRPHAASIAADGTRFVSLGPAIRAIPTVARGVLTEIYVTTTEGERVWTLNPYAHDIAVVEGRASATLSGDGSVVAIGFQTASRRQEFAVVDLASDAIYDRGAARATGLPSASGQIVVALDGPGDRFGLAAPGTGLQLGVIRVGRDGDEHVAAKPSDDDELDRASATLRVAARSGEAGPFDHGVPVVRVRGDESGGGDVPARDIVAYARQHPAGAACIALDRSGSLAAFGYPAPPEGARGRLRVEYLSPVPATASTIAVLDSLSLEPALPDLVALAFSHDSRQLACLASTGAIEIVPVP